MMTAILSLDLILMHKSLKCFHIFNVCHLPVMFCLSWSICVSWNTLHYIFHYFIAVCLANHVKSFCCRFAKIWFRIWCSLMVQFAVHNEIINEPLHLVQIAKLKDNASQQTARWLLLLNPTAGASPHWHLLMCYGTNLRALWYYFIMLYIKGSA